MRENRMSGLTRGSKSAKSGWFALYSTVRTLYGLGDKKRHFTVRKLLFHAFVCLLLIKKYLLKSAVPLFDQSGIVSVLL